MFSDVVFAVKMEKLVEKIKKYNSSTDNPKLIKTMFEIKQETEGFLNQKINMDDLLKVVENSINKNGINIKKEDFKKFKKKINVRAKYVEHVNAYMALCISSNSIYDLEDLKLDLLANFKFAVEEDVDIISAKIEYGCLLMLSGAILEFTGSKLNLLPVKRLGDVLFGLGVGFYVI
jgi:hypothetical protein